MEIKIEMEKKEGYEDYELESCMKTLEKSSEIRKDKDKMAALKEYAAKKAKTYLSIADLKAAAQEARDREAAESEEKILDPEDGLSELDKTAIAKGDKSAPY